MPTQAFPYLVMSDGVDTVTFQAGDGSVGNYPLIRDQWSPNIPALRRSPIGGRGPYEDVIEELNISIRDTTAAGVFSRLDILTRLLDKADRWAKSEQVNVGFQPVQIKYVPMGSTIAATATPLTAMVLRRASGDQTSGISLPVDFEKVGRNFEIPNLNVRFWRSGLWVHPTSELKIGTANPTGTLDTVTFTGNPGVLSPLDPFFETFPALAASQTISSAVILFGQAALNGTDAPIVVLSAFNMNTGVKYTSVADAANLPLGNILRYTPTDTTLQTATNVNLVTTGVPGHYIPRLMHIFATIRNNSGTTKWLVNARVTFNVLGLQIKTTPQQEIDTSSTQPRVVYLGAIALNSPTATLDPLNPNPPKITVQCQATAAAGSLDIDQIAVLFTDDLAARAVQFSNLIIPSAAKLYIYARATMRQQAEALAEYASGGGTNHDYPTAYGDKYFVASGTKVWSLMLATSAQYWRFQDGGAVKNLTPNYQRYTAYLSPQ